jgi:DNA-binding CsgD family transcriptional regulator/tetratricopeptide (TPR) repeat protein
MKKTSLGICLLPFSFLSATLPSEPLDQQVNDLLKDMRGECQLDMNCYQTKAERLWESSECWEKEIAFCVLSEIQPERTKRLASELTPCLNHYARLHEILGSMHFRNKDFSLALQEFTQSELEGMEPKSLNTSNLGATYFALNELDFAIACFTEALAQTDSSNLSSRYMILNNIAAIHIRLEEPNEALQWIEQAKVNLHAITESKNDVRPAKSTLAAQKMTIAANEWMAHILLNDTVFVRENWRNLNWGAEGPLTLDWVNLLTKSAPIINDEEFYAGQTRLLTHLMRELSPTELPFDAFLGTYNLLLQQYMLNPNDRNAMTACWKSLDLINGMTPQDNGISPSMSMESPVQLSNVSALVLLNALAAFLMSLVLWKEITAARIKSQTADQIVNQLKTWPASAKSKSSHLENLSRLSHMLPLKQSPSWLPSDIQLTESEMEVLNSIAGLERPKDLARRLDWTPNYVYVLRSRLRKKLNIPDDVSLDDFIASNNSTS